jgi:CDP-paratose 2-epimerase
VRDILWVDDLVRAMRATMAHIDTTAGEIFNMGGSLRNAVSVRQVIDRLGEITGRRVQLRTAPWRPGDQRIYISDTAKAERVLGWRAEVGWEEGLDRLVAWLDQADLSTPVLPLRTPQPATAARVAGAAL